MLLAQGRLWEARAPMTLRRAAYLTFVVLCLLALVWPGYDLLGNRVEPFVFGLPFTLAWNVGWVLASFLALALFHLTRPRGSTTSQAPDAGAASNGPEAPAPADQGARHG